MSFIDFILNGFKSIPGYLRKFASKALGFTKQLAAVLNSPEAAEAVKAIPGTTDDVALAAGKAFAATVVTILEKIAGQIPPEHEALVKNALLQKTQSIVLAAADGNKKPEHEYDLIAQKTYSAVVKSGATAEDE